MGPFPIGSQGFRREHQDRDVGGHLVPLERFQDVVAGDPREHQIQDDHVRVPIASERQCRAPVRGLEQLVTPLLEVQAAEQQHVRLVVDDQYATHPTVSSFRGKPHATYID